MTKEELEKEAEEKYSEVDREFIACQDEGEVFNIGYILGAEPREKQIQIDAEQIRALQKQNGELTDKVKELEAQLEREKNLNQCLSDHNEQLRELIEKMKCCSNCDNWNWKHNKCEKKLKGDCFKHSKWVMRNF